VATHRQRNIEEFLGQKGFRRKIVVFQTGILPLIRFTGNKKVNSLP
jgi:hypothetical protein